MKYIFLIFITLVSFVEAKEYKDIFDCSSKNTGYIASRMFLIERTMDMIEKKGDSVKFALTIHGSCAPIVSENVDEIIMNEDELANMQRAQTLLRR